MMFSILYFIVVLLATGANKANEDVHGSNKWKTCDKLGVHFYNELECKPKYDKSQTCPTSYTCKDYVIPNGKCLFQGKEIDNEEIVDGSYCNRGFICHAEENQKGYFKSGLIIDCFFGTPQEGCYRGGELRRCCQDEICPSGDVFTCKVGNRTYKERELFVPEGTCWNCICKPGLELFKEPYCIRRPCDMELRNAAELEKKCAPVYRRNEQHDGLCCPRSFICPEDIIKETPITTSGDSKDKCSFGDKTYNIGDQIEVVHKSPKMVTQETRICTCLLPPYLSCQ